MTKALLRSWRGRIGAIICAALLMGTLAVQAQSLTSPAASKLHAAGEASLPAYDVISVKPDKTGSGNVGIDINDANFAADNVSLKIMIESAYGLKDDQVFGLPKWGETLRFDIRAKIIDPDKKALAALTPEQRQAMQQPILADRFHLKFHRETKMLPVYELVVMRGGPRFRETTPAETDNKDGVNGVRAGGVSIHNRSLTATGVPLSRLADHLSFYVQRTVVDKTALTGKYNLQLNWSPDDAGPSAADAAAPPDIFTALQEQLGLKLEAGKAEIETLVVDSAEIPIAD